MSEPFLGEIRVFPYNFAPRGWANCDGQLLSISQYSALFSLLGTTYGGDGRTTFALPDLRGRFMTHEGTGPGLSPYRLGQKGGAESVTLTIAQMPSHNHTMHGETTIADSKNPTNKMLAGTPSDTYATQQPADDVTMAAESIGSAGGGQSFGIISPYLALRICIALMGVFPSRN